MLDIHIFLSLCQSLKGIHILNIFQIYHSNIVESCKLSTIQKKHKGSIAGIGILMLFDQTLIQMDMPYIDVFLWNTEFQQGILCIFGHPKMGNYLGNRYTYSNRSHSIDSPSMSLSYIVWFLDSIIEGIHMTHILRFGYRDFKLGICILKSKYQK